MEGSTQSPRSKLQTSEDQAKVDKRTHAQEPREWRNARVGTVQFPRSPKDRTWGRGKLPTPIHEQPSISA